MFRTAWKKLKRLLRRPPDPPEDPYSYVGAPKKAAAADAQSGSGRARTVASYFAIGIVAWMVTAS